jgi:PIN domain nuclease of toxin-antitoxin system
MKLLLDTCTFLWIASGDDKLSPDAAKLFSDPLNEVYLSAVSAWEINVKNK